MDINGQSLDSTADPSITANVNSRVNQTNQDVANSYSQPGINAARGLLNQSSNFNSGMSYGDTATSAAIKSRYDQKYQMSESALKTDVIKNADQDHLRSLQTATAAAGQEVEQNRQKALIRWKIEQANKKARGAILGTTLGIVGGVVAGVYSGGAAAPAGFAAGEGIGNAVGSS